MHHVFCDGRLCLFDRFCGNKRSLHLHIEIENQFSFSFHICSKHNELMCITNSLTGIGGGLGTGGGGLVALLAGGESSSEEGGDRSFSLSPSEIT